MPELRRALLLLALLTLAAANHIQVVAQPFPFLAAAEFCLAGDPCADSCLEGGIGDLARQTCYDCLGDHKALRKCLDQADERMNTTDWKVNLTHPALIKCCVPSE